MEGTASHESTCLYEVASGVSGGDSQNHLSPENWAASEIQAPVIGTRHSGRPQGDWALWSGLRPPGCASGAAPSLRPS